MLPEHGQKNSPPRAEGDGDITEVLAQSRVKWLIWGRAAPPPPVRDEKKKHA